MHGGRFLHSFVHTMRGTFDYVYVMRDDTRWASDDRYTFVVAASEAQISSRQIEEANFLEGRPSSITQFKPHSDFEVWQGSHDDKIHIWAFSRVKLKVIVKTHDTDPPRRMRLLGKRNIP
ncbi:MAG TPA: hypothetical protein EYN37_09970 [Dehalococcoidia bacterium]|nr:hypothetical protein [Dehalococcoidia bacterium]